MRRSRLRSALAAELFAALLATRAPGQIAICVGDCGGDGAVSVDELVRGVGIALGLRGLGECPAFDRDGDGQVSVSELVAAVSSALAGCRAATTPTASAPPSPSATATASPPPSDTASPTPSATATPTASATPTATRTPRPNFVVINLDDTRADGIDGMAVAQARLAGEGVAFSEAFVPNPVCCPSRASLLTGLYAIHHGTAANGGPLGGADRFRESGADRQTIAVWLRDAGYATGLFGKYLNDYGSSEADKGPGGTFYIPPGWERWRAQTGVEAYGGVIGRTYRVVDETRAVTEYGDHDSDAQYATDLIGSWLREFVADTAAEGRPFFAYWAPNASHGDAVVPAPALRHLDAFAALAPLRLPNWNEADISDKPVWLSMLSPDSDPPLTDAIRRRAYESLLAVDEQLSALLLQLATLGIDDRTVVLLTSDNGVGWGEHRQFFQFKESPYEECLRVPLLARYPRGGQAGRTVEAPALNLDVPVTLAALAGVPLPVAVDGRSLAAHLTGAPAPPPRPDFLLEHVRAVRGHALVYRGQVVDGDQLRLFLGDPRARPRDERLYEFDSDGMLRPGSIQVPIGPTAEVTFLNLGRTVVASAPQTLFTHNPATGVLAVGDTSPERHGVYWQIVRDQAGVVSFAAPVVPPDYVGVRDVARGYTYVEYETEEVELYDLDVDPWQLENRAADPAYAGVVGELSRRVAALLATEPGE